MGRCGWIRGTWLSNLETEPVKLRSQASRISFEYISEIEEPNIPKPLTIGSLGKRTKRRAKKFRAKSHGLYLV